MKKTKIILFGITLLSFIVSACFYPQMPEKIVFDLNSHGQTEIYQSKIGLFYAPLLLAWLILCYYIDLLIKPIGANLKNCRLNTDKLFILFSILIFLGQFLMILWNIGIKINPNFFIAIVFGCTLFYTGILFEKTKKMWIPLYVFALIPYWKKNYKKYHKIIGRLFKVFGIIIFIVIFFQGYPIFFILIPIIFTAIYIFIYSYIEYQKIDNK